MNELRIGNLKINLPIIQGAWVLPFHYRDWRSAVANEGGCWGNIHCCYRFKRKGFYIKFLEANIRALKGEIRKAREKNKRYPWSKYYDGFIKL